MDVEGELEQLINMLKAQVNKGWGAIGERQAIELEQFLREMLAEYSAALGYSAVDLLKAMEAKRRVNVSTYYHRANFPALDNVHIFKDLPELQRLVSDGRYRCPACGGVSKNAYVCTTGREMPPGSGTVCRWRSCGLLGTCGAGLRYLIKEHFLDNPVVEECFMPLAFENAEVRRA